MKITRRRYETSKRKLADLATCQQTVRMWEDAMKEIGPVGGQEVIAIEITKDGKINKVECKPQHLGVVRAERDE